MADLRPADDHTISAGEFLYVRIFPTPDSIVPADGGGQRPHSGSIKGREPNEPMSVDLGSLCTPEQTRDRGTNGNFHVAMITAGEVRVLGFRVVRDPIAGGQTPNPAHAVILGSRPSPAGDFEGALTGGEYSKIARKARFIIITVQPEGEGAGA